MKRVTFPVGAQPGLMYGWMTSYKLHGKWSLVKVVFRRKKQAREAAKNLVKSFKALHGLSSPPSTKIFRVTMTPSVIEDTTESVK